MTLIDSARKFVVGIIAGVLLAAPAAAQTESQVVYTRGQWEVRVVSFPDATLSCVARVQKSGSSFSIWFDGYSAIQLQFFSTAWSFNNEVGDIVVQVDGRPRWDLTDADMDQNSIHFTLPDNDAAGRFLGELRNGTRLKLLTTSLKLVEQWSLSGSASSMSALADCAEALMDDGNPFN